jgi:phage terminase large subunit-like protein
VSWLFSAEEPDRLSGKQHMKPWCDELAAWREPNAFDQALLGLRLGDKPQAVVTTTPRPTKIIKSLAADGAPSSPGSTFRQPGPSGAGVLRTHHRALPGAADRAPGADGRKSSTKRPVRAVHATRGKFLRAEPIAAGRSPTSWASTVGAGGMIEY